MNHHAANVAFVGYPGDFIFQPIPLLQTGVSAGFPSPADDYIDRALDLNELLVTNPPATFFVPGKEISGPPPGRFWTISKQKFIELDADRRIWWGVKGSNQPRLKRFLSEVRDGVVLKRCGGMKRLDTPKKQKKKPCRSMQTLFLRLQNQND